MKKIKFSSKLSLILLGAMSIFFTTHVSADDEISVYVNGERLNFEHAQPTIRDGRTLVPMRAIFEGLNVEVEWVGESKTINAIKDDLKISMQIDNNTMYVNNNAVQLEVPPSIIDDSTMVPVRAISECLDADVQWFQAQQAVVISKDAKTLYAKDGRMISVDESKVSEYLNDGWYENIDDVQQKLYAVDGRSIIVLKSKVSAYLNVGWYESSWDFPQTLYATDGKTITVPKSKVTEYERKGWYTNKDYVLAKLYSLDGRTTIVYKAEVPAYKNVGWYESEEEVIQTLYSLDGRSITVYKAEVPAYKKVGWYEKIQKTTDEITEYLTKNYSKLTTSIGDTNFSFMVFDNDREYNLYDYNIYVYYDSSFFIDINSSIKYTLEEKETVKVELKNFMETMAKDIIKFVPGNKLCGEYHDSYYRYPNIEMGLVTITSYAWSNYSGNVFDDYYSTYAADFRWVDESFMRFNEYD